MSVRVVCVAVLSVATGSAGVAVAGPVGSPLPSWGYDVTTGAGIALDSLDNTNVIWGLPSPPPSGFAEGAIHVNPAAQSGNQGTQTIRLVGLTDDFSPLGPYPQLTFNNPYSLKLSIQDGASGQVGTVTISGRISGYFSEPAYSSLDDNGQMTSVLSNVFTSPATQYLTLGNTQYAISAVTFTAPFARTESEPSPVGAFDNGEIDVTVTPMPAGVATPEPATLTLAGIGLGVAGIARLRRMRELRVEHG